MGRYIFDGGKRKEEEERVETRRRKDSHQISDSSSILKGAANKPRAPLHNLSRKKRRNKKFERSAWRRKQQRGDTIQTTETTQWSCAV